MSKHIVILGAGISGLAVAWFLKQYAGGQLRLTLIDKSVRAGGWIQSLQMDNFLFEQGPRSFRSKGGQETLALVEALELQDQLITPHSEARNRYIYHEKQLCRLPRHLWEVPFSPLTRGWTKALWYDWRMPKRQVEDETIYTFFARRFGQSWVDRFIDPFVRGIYAGDCRSLSLKSCFPLFDQWEQEQGSLLWGAWRHRPKFVLQSSFVQSACHSPLFSFKDGMETLPRALASRLTDCLSLGQTVHRLLFSNTEVIVELDQGQCLKADHVISTLPTFALSPLFASHQTVTSQLDKLVYATIAVVNLGFDSAILPLKGFGYLIPSSLGLPLLGCVWDSCIFPQQNKTSDQTRLAVMIGGSQHAEIEQMSESELIEQALKGIGQHLKIQVKPQVIQVKKAKQAIPQYEIGYETWKNELFKTIHSLSPHFTLGGSAFTGVSINDCIGQARQLAQQLAVY